MNAQTEIGIRTAKTMDHTSDIQCTLDANDTCVECGVIHGDPCPDCGGKGFHLSECPVMCPHMLECPCNECNR